MAKTISWVFVAIFVGLALVFVVAYADPLKIGQGVHPAPVQTLIP